MGKLLSHFVFLLLLVSIWGVATLAMVQVRHDPSGIPKVLEFDYQPIFERQLTSPNPHVAPLEFLPQAGETCTHCIDRFQHILDILDNDPDHKIDQLIAAFCENVIDPAQHSTCIAKATEAVWRIRFAITQEIDWKAIDFCAFLSICIIDCCQSELPEQVYMTVGDTNRDRNFVFTMRTGIGGMLEISQTPFATHPQASSGAAPTNTYPSSSVTYTAGQWKGYIHTVSLERMPPGKYYYRVGVPALDSWSRVFSTTIHDDTIGSNAKPLRAMVFGDIDLTKYSVATRDLIKKLTSAPTDNLHIAVMIGDLGYSDCAERKWNVFLNWVQDNFTVYGIPILAVPGNHESFCYKAFQGYQQRFPNGSRNQLYYSVSYGKVHINMLNSEHVEQWNAEYIGDDQLTWFKSDIAQAQKAGTSNWYISALHRPLFCSWAYGDCNEKNYLRSRLEQPFNDYKMDMVFYGHLHAFERSTQLPISNGIVDAPKSDCTWDQDHTVETCAKGNGPVYVLTGAPGNSHSVPDPADFSQKPWSSAVSMKEGIGILSVTDTQLQHQFYDSPSQKVIDTVVIRK